MIYLANFLRALAIILDKILFLYMLIIIGRAVISWVNADPYNPIVRFLYAVTEPVLYQVRKRLPINFGGIDFSPVVVLLVIYFIQLFLVKSLADLAYSLASPRPGLFGG